MHLDDYLMCLITDEGRLMKFVTDRNELVKCGMEHKHENKEMNADIFIYPTFMTLKEHPLHKEYAEVKTLLKDETSDKFVIRIRQKIERELNNERKTRMKCITFLLYLL